MKVALNGTVLLTPLTGVGQYCYQLARRLQQQPGLDLSLFYGRGFEHEVREGGTQISGTSRQLVRKLVPHAYAITRWMRQRKFDRGVRGAGFDLYHDPNFLAFDFPGPTVLSVHDLSWIRYPQTHPPERVRAMDKYFEPGLRKARLVLTGSEFVKREVVEVFGIAPERIIVVANGLDPMFQPMTPDATRPVLSRHGLEHGNYFLCVGTLEPRKNVETAVHAYGELPREVRDRLPLVLAGLKGWRTQSLEKYLEPLVASGHVRILGYLERIDLVAVTAGALAMVYPSLYEGFGLPPLEAMGCGVPAITSNVSSLPEVVGDTGLYVDPLDVFALRDAMRTMADDPALRAGLAAKAQVRAAGFTWDRCAGETAAVYRRAVSTTSR